MVLLYLSNWKKYSIIWKPHPQLLAEICIWMRKPSGTFSKWKIKLAFQVLQQGMLLRSNMQVEMHLPDESCP
jgi:hypothetical protein